MNGVESLFSISLIMLLVMWIWFIVLGFRTSRLWGVSLIFLFPISPLLFAYRFERKTRHTIYYFIASLMLFVATMLYINFATIDFFGRFSHKLATAIPRIELSRKPKVKVLNLPKPTPIPPPLKTPPEPNIKLLETPHIPVRVVTSRYKSIAIGSVQNYVGKNVIITTPVVVHRGKLTAVDNTQVEIKKAFEGGSTIMGIKKSKIEKIEVYL